MSRTIYEECADKHLSFNEIGIVAATLYADLEYEQQSRPVLKKVARLCNTTEEQAAYEIGWDGLYNKRFENILREYPVTTFIDRWGARCWRTPHEKVCGDDSGFYPWFTSEKLLRKRIKESLNPR